MMHFRESEIGGVVCVGGEARLLTVFRGLQER